MIMIKKPNSLIDLCKGLNLNNNKIISSHKTLIIRQKYYQNNKIKAKSYKIILSIASFIHIKVLKKIKTVYNFKTHL